MSHLVGTLKPKRIISGLKTKFNLSSCHSAHKVIKPQILKNLHKSVLIQIHTKQNKHQTQYFRRKSPFGIALLKRHIKLEHAGIVDYSVDLSMPYLF